MTVLTSLKTLDFDEAIAAVDQGAAFVDLRPTAAYLDVHVPGSLDLLYEFGPGMAQRARDCIPLDVPLILLDLDHVDLVHATASLRGKGFTVLGEVDDAINAWAERRTTPGSTELALGSARPEGMVLDVGDPGGERVEGATVIPIERLWGRAHEFAGAPRVVIVAGYGVRAGLAIGMLERAGAQDLVFWRTRA
ncbi:MAG: hypothetical protein ACRDJJ_00920 [Actinomycetota bacterium]